MTYSYWSMRISFGKSCSKPVEDLQLDYLECLQENVDLRGQQKDEVCDTIGLHYFVALSKQTVWVIC